MSSKYRWLSTMTFQPIGRTTSTGANYCTNVIPLAEGAGDNTQAKSVESLVSVSINKVDTGGTN